MNVYKFSLLCSVHFLCKIPLESHFLFLQFCCFRVCQFDTASYKIRCNNTASGLQYLEVGKMELMGGRGKRKPESKLLAYIPRDARFLQANRYSVLILLVLRYNCWWFKEYTGLSLFVLSLQSKSVMWACRSFNILIGILTFNQFIGSIFL